MLTDRLEDGHVRRVGIGERLRLPALPQPREGKDAQLHHMTHPHPSRRPLAHTFFGRPLLARRCRELRELL